MPPKSSLGGGAPPLLPPPSAFTTLPMPLYDTRHAAGAANGAASTVASAYTSASSAFNEAALPLPPLDPYDDADSASADNSSTELHTLLQDDIALTQKYTTQLSLLQSELNKTQSSTTAMVKYLESEIRRKDLLLVRLRDQQQDLIQNHANDLAMMTRQFNATTKYMEKVFLTKEKSILEKNDKLETNITQMSEYHTLRAKLASELEETKQVIFQNERTHKLQLDTLEKKFLAARENLQREASERIAQSRITYKSEIGKELEKESIEVRTDNTNLQNELTQYESTSNRLQKQNELLTKRISELKRDYELTNQQNSEYLKKSKKQEREIDVLTKETSEMETLLLEEISVRRDKEIRKSEQETSDYLLLKAKYDEAYIRSLEVNHQHTSLKRKARKLLQQRSSMNTFFLSAIDDVRKNLSRKRELVKQERDLIQQAKLRELTLPPLLRNKGGMGLITNGNSTQSMYGGTSAPPPPIPTSTTSPLDLSDLTLEDRERVLRLLYSKIMHISSSITQELPKHSFDISITGVEGRGRNKTVKITQNVSTKSGRESRREEKEMMMEDSGYDDLPQLHDGDSSKQSLLMSGSNSDQQQHQRAEYDMTFLTNMQADGSDDDDEDDDDYDEIYSSRSQQKQQQHFAPPSHPPQQQHRQRPMSGHDETD